MLSLTLNAFWAFLCPFNHSYVEHSISLIKAYFLQRNPGLILTFPDAQWEKALYFVCSELVVNFLLLLELCLFTVR